MEIPWGEIATAGPLILAGLGIAVSLIPNISQRIERRYFVVLFFLIGGITWRAQEVDRNQLIHSVAREARGGDSYCYFHLNLAEQRSIDGPYMLFMHGVGSVSDMNYWISPAWTTTDGKQPEYASLDYRKPRTQPCPAGIRASDRTLPKPDEYRIEFDAANGHWDEILKISIVDGMLRQDIRITSDTGKLIYHTTQ